MQAPDKKAYYYVLTSAAVTLGLIAVSVNADEAKSDSATLPKMEKVDQPAVPNVPKPDVPAPVDPNSKPIEPMKPADNGVMKDDKGAIKVEVTQEYKNEKGYAIKFPKGWEVKEGFMGLDVFALSPLEGDKDVFRENVNLVTEDLTKDLTLSEYYKLGTDNLKTLLTDFKEEGSGDVTLADGTAGKWISYEHRMGEIKAKVLQYIFVKGKRAYIITFTASPTEFDKYRPAFEAIEKTFEIK